MDLMFQKWTSVQEMKILPFLLTRNFLSLFLSYDSQGFLINLVLIAWDCYSMKYLQASMGSNAIYLWQNMLCYLGNSSTLCLSTWIQKDSLYWPVPQVECGLWRFIVSTFRLYHCLLLLDNGMNYLYEYFAWGKKPNMKHNILQPLYWLLGKFTVDWETVADINTLYAVLSSFLISSFPPIYIVFRFSSLSQQH